MIIGTGTHWTAASRSSSCAAPGSRRRRCAVTEREFRAPVWGLSRLTPAWRQASGGIGVKHQPGPDTRSRSPVWSHLMLDEAGSTRRLTDDLARAPVTGWQCLRSVTSSRPSKASPPHMVAADACVERSGRRCVTEPRSVLHEDGRRGHGRRTADATRPGSGSPPWSSAFLACGVRDGRSASTRCRSERPLPRAAVAPAARIRPGRAGGRGPGRRGRRTAGTRRPSRPRSTCGTA